MKGNWLQVIIFFLVLSPVGLIAQEDEEENPHLEMLKDQFVCLDCHTRLPKEGETSSDYFLVDLPSENCLGCHSEVEHSGVKEHEGKESKPLLGDENGKMACFTCHDPHPQGAIAGRTVHDANVGKRNRTFTRIIVLPDIEKRVKKEVSSGAKTEVYLRFPVEENKICMVCHKTLNETRWRRRILWDKFLDIFSY